jgi:hypothetical protein
MFLPNPIMIHEMTLELTGLLFGMLQTPLVAYSHHQVITSPTIRSTTPPRCRLSRSQILEGALYAAEKSYGWKTAEVSRQPLVPFRMINDY